MANRSSAILFEPPAPVPFARAWQWQRQLQGRLLARSAAAAGAGPTAVAAEASEALLLLEHEACYTLGRGADPAFLGADDFARFLGAEMPRWAIAVQKSGARLD